MPILQMGWRSSLCGTNHSPLTEKVMRCKYSSRLFPLDVLGKGKIIAIRVQVGVTDGAANVLWHKILRRVKKKGQNTVVHIST